MTFDPFKIPSPSSVMRTNMKLEVCFLTFVVDSNSLQATFFMTYVLTSGWASLSSEIMQPYMLLCNFFYKFILRNKDDPSNSTFSYPYHTEIPRVLLFGFLGFTYSLLAPLILPFLLVYFFLANLVYRNQVRIYLFIIWILFIILFNFFTFLLKIS